jgi:hypothetical protein
MDNAQNMIFILMHHGHKLLKVLLGRSLQRNKRWEHLCKVRGITEKTRTAAHTNFDAERNKCELLTRCLVLS